MSLRPKENLEYQEKTSGVSSSWNSLQIGQKWTLAGDDGWWTSGGGFTNPRDMKHFCTFLNMFNIYINIMRKNGISIRYRIFHIWIISRKIDISNRYQKFLFPLKIQWARKSKDCSFPPELSKLKFMHTYCWMSTPLWSEQQLHITSECKPRGFK